MIPEVSPVVIKHSECKYYPCHSVGDISEFSCLFCFCPLYHKIECSGTFDLILKDGGGYIKDCKDCSFPHKRSNYQEVLDRLAAKNYILIERKPGEEDEIISREDQQHG